MIYVLFAEIGFNLIGVDLICFDLICFDIICFVGILFVMLCQGHNARKVAVAYTLRTYLKQFSLEAICKQE